MADARDWKVFISSPVSGLEEYRAKARDAIDGMEGFSVVRQEDFGARGGKSIEVCVAKVKSADVLVGLAGSMYGSTPERDERSFSIVEFETAQACSIQCLMFLLLEGTHLPDAPSESEAALRKQKEFIKRIYSECTRSTVQTPDEFARKTVQALHNWERNLPPGRARHASLSAWFDEQRASARKALGDHGKPAFMELCATPSASCGPFTGKDLFDTAMQLQLRGSEMGAAFIPDPTTRKPEYTAAGVRASRGPDVVAPFRYFDYWYIRKDGTLYAMEGAYEEGPDLTAGIGWHHRARHVRSALLFLYGYYAALGLNSADRTTARFTHGGLAGKRVFGPTAWDARLRGAATEDQIETEVAFTLADLAERNTEIVESITAPLFELFDGFRLADGDLARCLNGR